MFGLVERFIAAKVLDVSREYALGDQNALQALVRFGDEEIKHQELFRRIERMCAAGMPGGYTFVPEPNAVASAVLAKSTWAVLALTCHIELFVLAHYRQSIDTDAHVCELWKDVFLHHAQEESQHAILDEMEWVRENAKITSQARDAAVDDLIALVGAVDGILQVQSRGGYALLRRNLRPAHDGDRGRSLAADRSRCVSLAVHRLGRAGAAFQASARRHDHRSPGGAHQRGAGADHGWPVGDEHQTPGGHAHAAT